MSIYVWKVGEIALARLSKKVYAKVRIVKNEDGIFHDKKVLGMSSNADGTLNVTTELCYHVEISRTSQKLWLPYTSLHLAERSRPFYGTDKVVTNTPEVKPSSPKKRKIKEDHTVSMDVKVPKPTETEPDLNTIHDNHHSPTKQDKYENAFLEYVRRGKDTLFDNFYTLIHDNMDVNLKTVEYLKNANISTEHKFETIINNKVTEKEIDHYFHQCWRYNYVSHHTPDSDTDENDESDSTVCKSPEKVPSPTHITWCLVCGEKGKLQNCPDCPSSFHAGCRRDWIITILHRKNPPKKTPKTVKIVQRILSSTRTLCAMEKSSDEPMLCPSCMWGPKVGYSDVVWHKLPGCPWWPARVLRPGHVPACLATREHTADQWPLRYYGTQNHAWGETARMCLFLPSHAAVDVSDFDLQSAILDACDDYIMVYLT